MGEVFYRIAQHYVSLDWGQSVFVDIYSLSGDFVRSLEVSGSQEDITSTLEGQFQVKVRTGLAELGHAILQHFQNNQAGRQDALERFRVGEEELADVGLA